jgi:signal-transduction protein with cAMP-binding, CBS, and nucleotidyltransferase domain
LIGIKVSRRPAVSLHIKGRESKPGTTKHETAGRIRLVPAAVKKPISPGRAQSSTRVRVKAMFSQAIKSVMQQEKLLTAPPETTVNEAAQWMAERNVGAVLVVEHGRLTGIFTERDAVYRVIARGRDPQTTRLAEVMTTAPKTVDPNKSFGYALLMMYENGFRHLPVIEEGKVIGVVSARHALDPDLEEFVAESHRRKLIARERN